MDLGVLGTAIGLEVEACLADPREHLADAHPLAGQAKHGLASLQGVGDLVAHAVRRRAHFRDKRRALAQPGRVPVVDRRFTVVRIINHHSGGRQMGRQHAVPQALKVRHQRRIDRLVLTTAC